MDRVWSEGQKEVIYSNDDRILVSASAGSGKTTVMIERILRLLSEGAKLSDMLICTFTKASAADMRAKLYGEMTKRGMKDEIKELSRADISTIDSFCQRLVSKYFYELGIDPQFDVLDELESKTLISGAVEKAIEECEDDDDFYELERILRVNRKNKTLKDAISAIMNFSAINQTFPSYSYDEEQVRKEAEDYMFGLKKKVSESIERLFEVIDEDVAHAQFCAALETGSLNFTKRQLKNKEFGACIDYLRDKIDDYYKVLDKFENLKPQSDSERFIRTLIKAAKKAQKDYADEKSKRSAVDFADLESMAMKILISDAKYEIRKKYKYIFVDEYQDINPLQESILSSIAEGNSLFMVGDIKQSIYAFRGCAPEIFKNKYDLYKREGGGKVINLDINYRSSKKVVEFVNKVFSELMSEEFGGVDYKANPMISFTDDEGYVKIHLVTGKETKYKPDDAYSVRDQRDHVKTRSEAEADIIAQRIVELIGGPDNVTFGDIAILSRSMKTFEKGVARRLKDMNIPISLKEDAHYLDSPITGQLIEFLRLIDNKCDDKALAMTMLSPLGGFCENELATVRINGNGNFYECVYCSDDPKIAEFVQKLDRYCEYSLVKSADELADMIVSENGYFNYAFRLGEDSPEILDKFLEFLKECPYKSCLRSTLKFIDDHDPFAQLTGEENAVKFMTVHKSKGLEFKYVFLIGLEKSFKLRDRIGSIFIDKHIGMNVYEDHCAYKSDLQFVDEIKMRKDILEEELRIFYVALTRAKHGLELFGSLSDSKHTISAYETQPARIVELSECGSALEWLSPVLKFAKRYDISQIPVDEAQKRDVFIGKADDEFVNELKNYFDFSLPNNAPVKSYVSKLAHEDDDAIVMIPEPRSEGNAIERGNAYHRAMEAIDFSSPDISVVDEKDMELIDSEKLLEAAEKMKAFSGKIYKEKPFMLKLDASEAGIEGNGNMLVQGVIDLLFIDGDDAIIVDYKTGAAHGSFESGYFKQVELYALAVERLLSKHVTGKYLYYFDSGIFVEVK